MFSWGEDTHRSRAQLDPELQQILALLDNYAADPRHVVHKVRMSRDCPEFPVDQWRNIVEGQPVDITKVFGAQYTTGVDAKQTQDVGDMFQIAVRLPKQSRAVGNHGYMVVAVQATADATAFAFPARRDEYIKYQRYITRLFASYQSHHHGQIIELDKAIRLRAANQKHPRHHNFADFFDFQTIFLDPNGMGPNSG